MKSCKLPENGYGNNSVPSVPKTRLSSVRASAEPVLPKVRTCICFLCPRHYNDAFLLRTCHKASHTVIVRHNPRTVKVSGNLLFCQVFLSTKNLLQQVMCFRIHFIRDVQIISFRKESFAEIIRCAESFSIQRISSAATRCHVGRIT